MKNVLLINERCFLLDAYLQLNLLKHKTEKQKEHLSKPRENKYFLCTMCALLKISASNINQMSRFNWELTSIVDSSNKLIILLLNVST